MKQRTFWLTSAVLAGALATQPFGLSRGVHAQGTTPEMLDRALAVRTVVSDLASPIGVAFLDRHEMLVLEKDTGRVQLVVDGKVTATVLDLGVNNSSERGLLGVALHSLPQESGRVFVLDVPE